VSLLALVSSACGSGSDGSVPEAPPAQPQTPDPTDPVHMDQQTPTAADKSFLLTSTVSERVGLPLPKANPMLAAERLAQQLAGYDPGSLLRCELGGQAAYASAIDSLGGVRWGYSVTALEDLSKPRFQSGFPSARSYAGAPASNAGDASAAPVEIVLPDIVAVTDSAALFYSAVHGLMLVDLTSGQPQFKCATQLPGNVGQFFYRDGHLVAMTQAPGTGRSALLHFRIDGTQLRFVESVDLGKVNILDSRRFNDELVFYTDLRFDSVTVVPPAPAGMIPINSGATAPARAAAPTQHRSLRVFQLGETLQEKMHDTLLDTSEPQEQLATKVTRDTPVDTQVSEAQRFGQSMWASDHYFVVTEDITKTFVSGWASYTYTVCTDGHTVETPYTSCQTRYETRPNPDYTPPDNSGGDRSCQGATLSDCLQAVARVSNPTIQVPVGISCEERKRSDWVCDASAQVTTEYPTFRTDESTRLYIYEYGDAGFVRVDSSVHEITNQGLEATSPDAALPNLTTSAEAFDLAVPGAVQTLYFQNGFLYVISQGVLQVYAMGGSSIVRTSTLPVVNETLQSSLFSSDRLYLSDFGYGGSGDHSTLRVVNLSNPAFPSVEASTYSLPGGHRSILASDYGIFTIGSVQQFGGPPFNAIKLGLFSDPFVDERAYLILATDLSYASLGDERTQLFNAAQQRTLLPYFGYDQQQHQIARIGISRLEPDQIASEGAVVVPEPVQRVRPVPGPAESYLSFASSSIEWLTPKEREWQSSPVLEYFLPAAVYRLNDQDDYVEVQRLGNRCRLFFANASQINQRSDGPYSEPFDCFGGGPMAYDQRLLFSDTGVEFDANARSIRLLSEDELAETRARIAERPTCMLSLDFVDDASVNYDNVLNARSVLCLSPTEYQTRLQQRSSPTSTP